jgi:hypothetical protein
VRNRHQQYFGGLSRILLATAFISFCLKIIMQGMVAVPNIAEAAYTIRNYIIGFIHLVLLGAITFFVLSYAYREKILLLSRPLARWGTWVLLGGFLFSEVLLFLQGTMVWGGLGFLPGYYALLFAVSTLLPLGVLLILMGQRA